jgi:hypothetical protein
MPQYTTYILHCIAAAANMTLKALSMDLAPRTKFIWSNVSHIGISESSEYEHIIAFLHSNMPLNVPQTAPLVSD